MIDIQLDDREVREALVRLSKRLSDMTPVMRAIATELEARVEARFETETDPAGRRWPQLADSTLMQVMRRAAGGKVRNKRGGTKAKAIAALARKRILYDTGDLLGSLTSSAGRDEARVGFGQPYAAYHEYGTEKMHRRGLLMADPQARTLGETDREAVLDILRQALEDAAGSG